MCSFILKASELKGTEAKVSKNDSPRSFKKVAVQRIYLLLI